MNRIILSNGRQVYRHCYFTSNSLINFRQFSTKVKNELDQQPTTSSTIELSKETLVKLERLSGLHFKNQKEIDDLKEEIRLANQIFEVDTTGVQPLYSIVEELIDCPLREDEAVTPDQTKIFSNTSNQVEGFFVSPPANVVVDESETLKKIK